MSFNKLGLSSELMQSVKEQGYTTPTPIQMKTIPAILNKQDVMGRSQTGTGKTAGFALPLLQRLISEKKETGSKRNIRALIVTPTRELAAQVCKSIKTYGRHLPLRCSVVFGGISINPQIHELRRGVDILVATPGRLLDHVGQGTVDLSKIDILILDEADRMLDMGFIPDIKRIIALMPLKRQNLLFSATFSKEIKKLAMGFLKNPVIIEVDPENAAAELVTQVVHHVDKRRKKDLLSHLIDSKKWERVLVFTRTKHGANRLAKQLDQDGISSIAIHGNKSQGARTRALDLFKKEAVKVLVATDIAARGLDIQQLPHVVNYDLPNIPEDYVHRIGRTGRAGHEGEALSLVSVDEMSFLRNIEKMLKISIPKIKLKGYEPDPSIKAELLSRRGSGTSNRPFNASRINPRPGSTERKESRDSRFPETGQSKAYWGNRNKTQNSRRRFGKGTANSRSQVA
ncbi:MAG: DEAD/DEAH box helicase [Pseudomonadota bacterium]